MPRPWYYSNKFKKKKIYKGPNVDIDAFLNRTLPKNYDWLKQLSEKEIDARIDALEPHPWFLTKPFWHQKVAFLVGVQEPAWMFLLFLGSGKSWLVLNILKYRMQLGQVHKGLILVPDEVNIHNFLEEVRIHRHDLNPVPIIGKNRKERTECLYKKGNVYIATYSTLQVLLDNPNKASKSRDIQPELVREFASQFEFLGMDEVSLIKNPKSLTYKICNMLTDTIPYRYGLTGRPFARSPIDLWSECYAIDKGRTLSENYYTFRTAYFSPKETSFGIDWKFKKSLELNLNKALKNISIRYERSKEESKLLPIIKKVDLSGEAKNYYNELIDKMFMDSNKTIISNNFVRLREICAGYLRFKAEDGHEEIIDLGSEKYTILKQLSEALPDDCKMIIFYEYTPTGQRISRVLDDLGFTYRWVYGGGEDNPKSIDDFKNDPSVRFLIMNSHSGAYGLNLQVANYLVYFESPVSPLVRAQSEGRADRTGQQKAIVYMYDILVRHSVDEKIMGFLKEGNNLFDSIVNGKIKKEDLLIE